jgi:hypothetical protein
LISNYSAHVLTVTHSRYAGASWPKVSGTIPRISIGANWFIGTAGKLRTRDPKVVAVGSQEQRRVTRAYNEVRNSRFITRFYAH